MKVIQQQNAPELRCHKTIVQIDEPLNILQKCGGLSIPTADWPRIVVVENFLWLLDLDNLVLVGASGRGNAGQWIFALRRSNIFTSYHDLSCQGFLWQMLQ